MAPAVDSRSGGTTVVVDRQIRAAPLCAAVATGLADRRKDFLRDPPLDQRALWLAGSEHQSVEAAHVDPLGDLLVVIGRIGERSESATTLWRHSPGSCELLQRRLVVFVHAVQELSHVLLTSDTHDGFGRHPELIWLLVVHEREPLVFDREHRAVEAAALRQILERTLFKVLEPNPT